MCAPSDIVISSRIYIMSRTYRQTAYKQQRPKSIREHREQNKKRTKHNNLDSLDIFIEGFDDNKVE